MFHSVKGVLLEENQLVLYSVKLVLLKEENQLVFCSVKGVLLEEEN